jgi:hypothetical protein
MDVQYTIPIPKTPSKTTSRDNRLRIYTLYYDTGFTQDDIVLSTGYTRRQVQHALATRLTLQKHLRGRKIVLNTPQRKRLIKWATASAFNRRVKWADISAYLGWTCGEKAIRAAFKKEGYIRRHARRKLPLSDQNKEDRLNWVWEYIFWTEEQWFRVL